MGASSPAGKLEKTMSSNLLTMKFMQRAAASKEAKEAKEAESTGESNQPTPKRRRVSTEAESPRTSEMEAISAALAAEEEKRQEAIARQAAESGESQWVLDIPAASGYTPQPVVLAADSLDDGSQGGRRGYGNFKRKQREAVAEKQKQEELEARIKEKNKPHPDQNLKKLTSISGSGGRSSMMGAPDNKKKKRKSG
ncbi:hypothetical protein PENANT_c043G11170 [Penicillium antarcticum]|uniref:Uncharacterized protein n=1 Tax=Penicillium antarcticum TaxID=416450 RepID=A0A1V6PSA7_9EURO|nr:uncharacterized protein N7508_002646 [Penicillium antarcticum]KAJ5318138.1 hypothetical protein N7508_002646 [Penicillium antarcticum]OQD79823.1 hypothetical protein PENANT_c043G11170 [Penicillium antarcticum]